MGIFSDAPVATATTGKKTTPVEVAGLHRYAALKALEKNVQAQIASAEAKLKPLIIARAASERSNDSFEAIENGSTASMQLRVRNSRSALSDEEQALFRMNEIPFQPQIDTFQINPAYAGNEEMLAKIEQALIALALPPDFFQKTLVSKPIATEDSLAAIFKASDNVMKALLPLASTPAIRSNFGGESPLAVAKEVLEPKKEAASE